MTEQAEPPDDTEDAPEKVPVIVTSCAPNCGVRIGNRVNYCSVGCREWAEWGRDEI